MHRLFLFRKLLKWKSRYREITCYLLAFCLLSSCPCQAENVDTLKPDSTVPGPDPVSSTHRPTTSEDLGNTHDHGHGQTTTPALDTGVKMDDTADMATESQTPPSGQGVPSDVDASDVKATITPLDIYRKLYQQKRKSHMEAVKAILNLGGYEKQYKMIKLLMEKMIGILKESKLLLMSKGYSPGDNFPEDPKIQEVLSQVMENTAFVGDILLHLPDITHDILKRNREWDSMTRWGVGFCNHSNILQGTDLQLLNLVGQEMGIIEKSPDYVNPYKVAEVDERKKKEELENILREKMKDMKKQEKKKKRKEKFKKGPRLSGVRHTEL